MLFYQVCYFIKLSVLFEKTWLVRCMNWFCCHRNSSGVIHEEFGCHRNSSVVIHEQFCCHRNSSVVIHEQFCCHRKFSCAFACCYLNSWALCVVRTTFQSFFSVVRFLPACIFFVMHYSCVLMCQIVLYSTIGLFFYILMAVV